MSETRLTNIIEPEVFAPYMLERSLNQNQFYTSGVISASPEFASFLQGGGRNIDLPFWGDLSGDSDVPSETVATTVNNIAAASMVARRQFREKAWGSNDLAAALAGSDPYEAILNRVGGYWGKQMEQILLYSLQGVFADNAANDSSDLIVNIAIEDGNAATSANKISAETTIDAVMKRGDMYGDIIAIAMHSEVYKTLVKNNLIDFIPDSEGRLTIPQYMGLSVVVSDNMPKTAGSSSGYKYTSYLFARGAVAFANSAYQIMPVEVYRDPTKGGGIDILYTRQQFVMHPRGFSWVMAADTGVTPTDANLYAATSWNRVYQLKNTGVVALITNG